jgi:hypothetical protein
MHQIASLLHMELKNQRTLVAWISFSTFTAQRLHHVFMEFPVQHLVSGARRTEPRLVHSANLSNFKNTEASTDHATIQQELERIQRERDGL